MREIYYIILILFVCLTINSCAEIDRLPESENLSLSEQIWSSADDILVGTLQKSSDNLFTIEQSSIEHERNHNHKNDNIFLVKKNSSGSRDWITDLGISDEESGISMTFDSSDNVYITGYTKNGLEGNKDSVDFTVFLAKYDSYGNRLWMKKLGNSEVEYGARLIADSSDNIYVTGFSNDFDPRNTLLGKYDTSGNSEWTITLGSTLTGFAWDVTVDSKDNIYLTGFSENSYAQNISWNGDILQMKFNKDGIKL